MMQRLLLLGLLTISLLVAGGCVGARIYNPARSEYLQQVPYNEAGDSIDLAIIEFDDRGEFWLPAQLRDATSLIRERNAASKTGILVSVYVHGWTNNADPTRKDGNLQRARRQMADLARDYASAGPSSPDRIVMVYLGWRGDRISIPVLQQLTFWDRSSAAKRVASLDMQETLSALMQATKERPDSKVLLYGHSLGAAILERTIAPTLAANVQGPAQERRVAIDLVVLVNPAIEALHARSLVGVLRRHEVTVSLHAPDGAIHPSRGPLIVSITSEADGATGYLFPIGMWLGGQFDTFRRDRPAGEPSQRQLARTAEGHCKFLLSHHASIEDGQLHLREIPGRYNTTPFWIIRVSRDICSSHGDLDNPRLKELLRTVFSLNQIGNTSMETHLEWKPWSETSAPPATRRSRLLDWR